MARISGVDNPGASFATLIFRAVRKRLGRVPRPMRIHALAPAVLRGYAFMEAGQESATGVPKKLKKLGQVRVATRIGCPF
ncbi:MAG TPA: hypothetical protein VF039_06700 [Longimicrobiales bacterium]